MMRGKLTPFFSLFLTFLLVSASMAKQAKAEQGVLVLWWNVENLFDTQDDPLHKDEEFTPTGKLQWTDKRLQLKQMRIRHIISAVKEHPDYGKYPDVVAFAEVENERVFAATLSGLKGINYKPIYYESLDPRGIDVALAYNPQTLRPGASKAYTVNNKRTRKIIVAQFSASGKPFYVILNHWTSRAFDQHLSEVKRIAAAKVVRHIVDSLLVSNNKADVVVMGDFNDEAHNASLKETLGSSFDAAKVKSAKGRLLYNCWSGYEGIGSYFHNKKWQQIDHILLTPGVLDKSGLYAPKNAFRCFAFSKLLKENGKGTYATYEKRKYKGGYADHLPLLLKTQVGR